MYADAGSDAGINTAHPGPLKHQDGLYSDVVTRLHCDRNQHTITGHESSIYEALGVKKEGVAHINLLISMLYAHVHCSPASASNGHNHDQHCG